MGQWTKFHYLRNVSGVYRIRNIINGKIYIGSAVCLYQREAKHFSELKRGSHANNGLQNAYNKYGKDALVFEPIELMAFSDKEFLIEREQHFLDTLTPWKKKIGYNIRKVAHSNAGIPLSEEAKKKLSASITGRTLSEEHRRKIGDSNRGKKHTLEFRLRISERKKGKPQVGKLAKGERHPCSVGYCFISPQGVEYKGSNISEFCRVMSLSVDKMSKLHTGAVHQTRDGWRVPGREIKTDHGNAQVAFQ